MHSKVLYISDCQISSIKLLLSRYNLHLKIEDNEADIPGSYWGDSEAGLISNTLYARLDTPIHSLLHEMCHYICMDDTRRNIIDTNAEGDYDEENGVCYLQIILSDDIPEMGRKRMMEDMNTWGYTFRLGSANAWFNQDSDDALEWLKKYRILNSDGKVLYQLRN